MVLTEFPGHVAQLAVSSRETNMIGGGVPHGAGQEYLARCVRYNRRAMCPLRGGVREMTLSERGYKFTAILGGEMGFTVK